MKNLKKNMKPFDIELAKANHPVQTRDGRPVRILCYDRKFDRNLYPIVALVQINESREETIYYSKEGIYSDKGQTSLDLFMAPTKKEGWISLYSEPRKIWGGHVYGTEEEAFENVSPGSIATIKIEWEE